MQRSTQRKAEAGHWILTDDSTEAQAVRLGLALLPIGRVMQATAGIRATMTWVRHPVAKYLAVNRSATVLGRGAKAYLQASKGLRYLGYAVIIADPLVTYHYYRKGEYDKAIISHFGPPGAVYIYGKLVSSERTTEPMVVQPKTKKMTKMPEKQRMRLWRMGLRWCKKHNRYDRCSLRKRS